MRPMPELKVETVNIDELNLNPLNSKLHPVEQIDQIASSIERFGNCDPLGVWTNDDGELVIVEGHGRYAALRKLGITEVPIIRLDHLSDEQRRAFTLVENQLTRLSEFDIDMLKIELDNIVNIDMGDLGFDMEEIQVSTEQDDSSTQDYSDSFTDTLGVFITCKDEADQQRTYEEILEGGYECRLLTL